MVEAVIVVLVLHVILTALRWRLTLRVLRKNEAVLDKAREACARMVLESQARMESDQLLGKLWKEIQENRELISLKRALGEEVEEEGNGTDG